MSRLILYGEGNQQVRRETAQRAQRSPHNLDSDSGFEYTAISFALLGLYQLNAVHADEESPWNEVSGNTQVLPLPVGG